MINLLSLAQLLLPLTQLLPETVIRIHATSVLRDQRDGVLNG